MRQLIKQSRIWIYLTQLRALHLPKLPKRKPVKRKRYHHALTSITHLVNGQLVVLHPLTT